MTAPKRRWFQFSLRTMFVVVTLSSLAGYWFHRQRAWIQQRHEFLAKHQSLAEELNSSSFAFRIQYKLHSTADWHRWSSAVLWLFREPEAMTVPMVFRASDFAAIEGEAKRAKQLFPEVDGGKVDSGAALTGKLRNPLAK